MAQNPYMYGAPNFTYAPTSPGYQPQQNPAGSPSSLPFASSSHTAVNASFDHNASQIPGLMFASGSSNGFPFQSNSQVLPRPQLSPPKPTQPITSVPPTSSNANTQLGFLSKDAASTPREEGELSEGEFEDLYEPKEISTVARPGPSYHHAQGPAAAGMRSGSAGDADGSSIYDSGSPQGDAVIESTSISQPAAEQGEIPDDEWEPTLTQRERSRSYSPSLLPSEVDRPVTITKNSPNGSHPRKDCSNKENAILPAEAKKKAQEAILALWPHKVRFQNYIDEGLDQNVMKSLFKDLGLDTAMAKTGRNTAAPTTDPAETLTKTSPRPHGTPKESPGPTQMVPTDQAKAPDSSPKTSNNKPTAKSAAEERKDKIARKLAAKAQKSTTTTKPVPQPKPKDSNQPQAASTPPVKTKTRAETNALLRQKLAALKKQRGEVAAEIEGTKLPDTTAPAVQSTDVPVTPSHETMSSSTQPKALPLLISNSTPALGKPAGVQNLPTAPASMSSPQPVSDKIRNLKRPVASDFDNNSSPRAALKRTRTQDTLIIDVSDSEDDDVEMEMGSPVDEPVPSDESGNPTTRPFGSFPPLSDTTRQRQASSPGSSGGQAREGGLQLGVLTGKIEMMRRQIAEKEAMKKKPLGPNSELATPTPTPQAQTPLVEAVGSPSDAYKGAATPLSVHSETPVGQESAKLPKVAKAMKRKSLQRRDRIVSFDMPSVEATLKEKQERLKLLVAQAAQIELEVQASLAEKQKLDAEMNQLSDSSEDESADSVEEAQPVPAETIDDSQDSRVATTTTTTTTGQPAESHPQQSLEDHPATDPEPVVSTGISSTSSVAFLENTDGAGTPSNEVLESAQQPLDHEQTSSDATDQDANDSSRADERQQDDSKSDLSMDQDDDDSSEDDDVSMKTSDESSSDDDEDDGYEPTVSGVMVTSKEPESSNVGFSEVKEGPTLAKETDTLKVTQGLDNTSQQGYSVPAQTATADVTVESGVAGGKVLLSAPSEQPLLTHGQVPQNAEVSKQELLSYHSPLSYFRSYRFHPRYSEDVRGGLKSLTYSSKIDPMQPICEYSLAGEVCPKGKDCGNQHFEDIVLPDSDIITQIGASDMFSGETRTRFIEGLRQLLSDLRMKKIKDFEPITKAIIEYRANFLGDKTKVLPLDGVTL